MRKRAGDGAAHRKRLAMRIMQRGEQRFHPLVDGVAGIGEPQMTRGALDQPQAEIAFQPLHCSTEARLGMPEHARGGGKPAMFNDFAKQLPIAPLHARDCPSSGTVCPDKSDYRADASRL